ncbi:hypothetical protein GCM10027405_20860 [Arthrobacter alkaliphilus]
MYIQQEQVRVEALDRLPRGCGAVNLTDAFETLNPGHAGSVDSGDPEIVVDYQCLNQRLRSILARDGAGFPCS